MEHIIQLLVDRNIHLEKFAQINEDAMTKFAEGNYDSLESFYDSREGILCIINCIDKLIDQVEATKKLTSEQRQSVFELLREKNELVTEILSQDLQILSLIEKAKSSIIKELSTVRSGRKVLQKYKTGEIRRRVDESV